jgi:hypothetical protein
MTKIHRGWVSFHHVVSCPGYRRDERNRVH